MLTAQSLSKSFANRCVVSNVSLRLEPGKILGLLGPNGAGKSTTVSMICALIAPDGGSVTFDDNKTGNPQYADAYKRRIGLVPQDIALYEDLAAGRNLELFGALYGLRGARLAERVSDALNLVGLADRADDKPSTFSGGMKRRLNIACALVHDPDVLLLDEPTVGVDPQSRNAIFDNLEALRSRGKALLYTTHYMEEAERLCDRIVVMDHGRVVADDTLPGLLARLPHAEILQIDVSVSVDCAGLAALPGVVDAHETQGVIYVRLKNLGGDAARVLDWCQQHSLLVRRVNSARANLEDVFLTLTGSLLRDHA